MLEIGVYTLLGYWTVLYFDLKVDWETKSISSKTGETGAYIFYIDFICLMLSIIHFYILLPAFTYFEFNGFLKAVTVPSIWMGVLSLTWEIITSMFK